MDSFFLKKMVAEPPRISAALGSNPLQVGRLTVKRVAGAEEVFTPEFVAFFGKVVDVFAPRIAQLREQRNSVWWQLHQEVAAKGFEGGNEFLRHLATGYEKRLASSSKWRLNPSPILQQPGAIISGPVSQADMAIKAVNHPLDDGGNSLPRAKGYLDDDEDSAAGLLEDTVRAAINRLAIVNETLTAEKGIRSYAIEPSTGSDPLPHLYHRERGILLDEQHVLIDGKPVSATLLGYALTLFYVGQAQHAKGEPITWYHPKGEMPEEFAMLRDLLRFSKGNLPGMADAKINIIPLVESVPMLFLMKYALHELGEFAAGLNHARWDLQASMMEAMMADPEAIWADRFTFGVWDQPVLVENSRNLVALCDRVGGVKAGGMDVALPHKDPRVNAAALAATRVGKEREGKEGYTDGWSAHVFLTHVIATAFQVAADRGEPAPRPTQPVQLGVPEGPITVRGTRMNILMILEYLGAGGWFGNRGAKGIDSDPTNLIPHFARMEDLATFRMSVAQVAQRQKHAVVDDEGVKHDAALIEQLFQEELDGIIGRMQALLTAGEMSQPAFEDAVANYELARRVGLRWVNNYVNLDFAPLPAYTRDQLRLLVAG